MAGALALIVGVRLWHRFEPIPKAKPGDAARGEEAFWNSDLGSGAYGSIPRAVFDALPVLFPTLWPEGWETFGLTPNRRSPNDPAVGLVRTRWLGLDVYATNCAFCHAGTFQGKVVAGLPSLELDLQAMMAAIGKAVLDPRLTTSAVAKVAEAQGHPLSLYERALIPAWLSVAERLTRKVTNNSDDRIGPGRSDALNGWKRMLGLDASQHSSVVDIPPLFNQRLKDRTLLDGSVTGDMAVRVMLTEIRKGRPSHDALVHRQVFDDIMAYINGPLTPPRYPYPIDSAKAARGRDVYRETCQRCHGTYAPETPSYPNKRVDVERVGTDPERAEAMTPDIAKALSSADFAPYLTIEPDRTYTPPPLDGVWMTAPYLHNGSVPTLWHLLHAPARRPEIFYRHHNTYDPVRVGLSCGETRVEGVLTCPPDAEQAKHAAATLFRFDARQRGNGNLGHEYGLDLPEADKLDLIEYLKTL
jgi:mono/diheme cytochrome c family protein